MVSGKCWACGSRTRGRKVLDACPRRSQASWRAGPPKNARAAVEPFDQKWGERFPPAVQAWQGAWEHFTPFLAFTDEVRQVVYTTNAIDALNRQLRKASKTKGHFPSEDAARKLLYLAIQNAAPQMDPHPGMDEGAARVQDRVRRPAPGSDLTTRNRQPTTINLKSRQQRPHTSTDALARRVRWRLSEFCLARQPRL
jgi:Transposase, Mutator family